MSRPAGPHCSSARWTNKCAQKNVRMLPVEGALGMSFKTRLLFQTQQTKVINPDTNTETPTRNCDDMVAKCAIKKCPHGKEERRCRECGGSALCMHGRQKQRCRECGGVSICPHGKERNVCAQCGGASLCIHGRRKCYCRECGSVSFCFHGKRRTVCGECGGGSLCPHGKPKSTCAECGWRACEHGRLKHQCAECNNFICSIDGCPSYGRRFAGAHSLLYHMRSQHASDRKAQTKAKELKLYKFLEDASIPFEYQRHVPFKSCGLGSETQCAYLDFLVVKPWGYIVLECDEHQHKDRDPSCDVRRDFDIAASVALGSGQQLMVVRFNPDPYKVDGITKPEGWRDRCGRLLAILQQSEAPTKFERIFLCYDRASDDSLPCVASSWQNSAAKEVSRCA